MVTDTEVVDNGLKCLFDGCDNPVNTHKGVGGFCLHGFAERGGVRMTHRAIRLAELAQAGRGPGRHSKVRSEPKPKPKAATPPEPIMESRIVLETVNSAIDHLRDLAKQMVETEITAKELKESWNDQLDVLKLDV